MTGSESLLILSARELRDTLGHKVKARRLSLKMTQRALAEDAGIRQALISQIERGEANPTLDSILRNTL